MEYSRMTAKERRNAKKLMIALGLMLAASVTAFAMTVEAFADYEPPDRLNVTRYDYYDGRPGHGDGSPADGSRDTDVATWQLEYPHRAFFIGGVPNDNSSPQKHDTRIYVVFSRVPFLDYFDFSHIPTKGRYGSGYIRADFSRAIEEGVFGQDVYGEWHDIRILYWTATGLTSEVMDVPLYSYTYYPGILNVTYFDFDFYYQCCGDLAIEGLRNITEVPYPYILTCIDSHGSSGGGQDWGSSSGGGNSDGSSDGSGGDGSSGGGDGSSSSGGGDDGSSKGDWESDGSYPWEDDRSIPDLDWEISKPGYTNNGEDGEGENGDSWTLPDWGDSLDPPFSDKDLNIPGFPVDLEEGYPNFPVDLEEGYPDFPVDLEQSTPELPVDLENSYPEPYLPGWSWPPPFPGEY